MVAKPVPKVRRENLPLALLRHLLDRIQQRGIPASQLGLLAEWLDTQPEVPAHRWYKRFPAMTVCGEGELVKTFLTSEQIPLGEEIK
jgi:hypothetical protein